MMLYYKFKDSKWIKAKSKESASMLHGLNYIGFYGSFVDSTNNEMEKLV